MTVSEMIYLLQELDESGYGDTELRLAIQPSWPLAKGVSHVKVCEDNDGEERVWIAEGYMPSYQNPYAPEEAFEEW